MTYSLGRDDGVSRDETHLSCVVNLAPHNPPGDNIQIATCLRVDDDGRLPSKLESHWREVLSCSSGDMPSNAPMSGIEDVIPCRQQTLAMITQSERVRTTMENRSSDDEEERWGTWGTHISIREPW